MYNGGIRIMTRTTLEYKSNNNQQNAQIIEQILLNHAYYQISYFNETCYQESINGIWTHKYINYLFEGDILRIRGWITSTSSQGGQLEEYSLNNISEVTLKDSLIKALMDIEANINGVKINEYDDFKQRIPTVYSQQNISQELNQQQIQNNQPNNLTEDAFKRVNTPDNPEEDMSEDETTTVTSSDAMDNLENEKMGDAEYVKKLLEEDIDLKNSIAIVFNKDKLGEDYQSEAIRICEDIIDFRKAGTFCIYAGDKKDENYSASSGEYCLGIRLADTQTVKCIREAMIKASDSRLAPLTKRFIYEDDLDSQYLIYSGYVADGKLNLNS